MPGKSLYRWQMLYILCVDPCTKIVVYCIPLLFPAKIDNFESALSQKEKHNVAVDYLRTDPSFDLSVEILLNKALQDETPPNASIRVFYTINKWNLLKNENI
jgi:hypothetical protein